MALLPGGRLILGCDLLEHGGQLDPAAAVLGKTGETMNHLLQPSPIYHRLLSKYLLCLLNLLLAVGLVLQGQVIYALSALVLSAVALCFGAYQLKQLEAAHKQKCFLDEQLIQSQKLAAVGELSSGIAHEINNPLAIIGQEAEWMGHLIKDLAAGKAGKEDELQDSLAEILRQVDRCKDITHKLLDFARKKEPLVQGADINKLLEDMIKLVEKEAVHKGITITRNYSEDLPLVYTDTPLMRQVALNLLNNAVYAIGNNGNITVVTRVEGDEFIVVEVQDTGCGIAKEDLARIFDPFFTTKPQGKGTGLGLSICHGIVTRLGGLIRVESKPGEGSTFFVSLPLKMPKGVE